MRKLLLLICTFLALNYVSAQNTEVEYDEREEDLYLAEEEKEDPDAFFIDHKVMMGEKMIMISRKYMVDPKDIYKYNEDAINGVKEGLILKIPLHKSHKRDLDAFKAELEKKKGGPIQVPAPPKKRKRPVIEEPQPEVPQQEEQQQQPY